jgi:hypothetical protein
MGSNLSYNVGIDNTMAIDSIIITCISHFLKPLLDFDLMQKNSTLTNNLFCKCYS